MHLALIDERSQIIRGVVRKSPDSLAYQVNCFIRTEASSGVNIYLREEYAK